MSFIHKVALCAGMVVSVATFSAEALYTVQSDSLMGTTLFDQSLSGEGMITVKPSIPASATGDLEVMSQCLWSVKVVLTDGTTHFEPGKMVCVGPKQEVLETIPHGDFDGFGECDSGCEHFLVAGSSEVVLNLAEPLSFTLQPRNERK
jgi:hypothetical protein